MRKNIALDREISVTVQYAVRIGWQPRQEGGGVEQGRTWAATVCERVGKSLVMQAVFRPASAQPIAARRPAPPAPTTTASYSWSITS